MTNDTFGDRIKYIEQLEAGRMLMPLLPICIRLDGKAFHSFCKGLKRPYDERLSHIMRETTRELVEETNAKIGYTQSDEISLLLFSHTYESQVYFNGKIQKLVSVLSSMATLKFNTLLREYIPEKINMCPLFDCRAWQVPNKDAAVDVFKWREADAIKNSVSMAAQTYYSHKQLEGVGTADKKKLLLDKGISWEEYPTFFKRGSYFQRRTILKVLSEEELAKIPERYRPPATEEVERTKVIELIMPPISSVTNIVDVIFNGLDPKVDVVC